MADLISPQQHLNDCETMTEHDHNEKHQSQSHQDWVHETRFGKWFLTTGVWKRYVLNEAIIHFQKLLKGRANPIGTLLDIGCGQGLSIPLLFQHLAPDTLIGIDIDKKSLASAKKNNSAQAFSPSLTLLTESVTDLSLPDNSIDIIFCHQVIHHVSHQELALQEMHRILKPGGILLVSESCKPFIETWTVRWFFRHPTHAQKTAKEYQQLIKNSGFAFSDSDVHEYTPWWSLPDLGILRRLGLAKDEDEITEIQIVASKVDHAVL